MATYTITINERTKAGRGILQLLRNTPDVEIRKRKSSFELSLEDIREGRVFSAKDGEDLIRQCLE